MAWKPCVENEAPGGRSYQRDQGSRTWGWRLTKKLICTCVYVRLEGSKASSEVAWVSKAGHEGNQCVWCQYVPTHTHKWGNQEPAADNTALKWGIWVQLLERLTTHISPTNGPLSWSARGGTGCGQWYCLCLPECSCLRLWPCTCVYLYCTCVCFCGEGMLVLHRVDLTHIAVATSPLWGMYENTKSKFMCKTVHHYTACKCLVKKKGFFLPQSLKEKCCRTKNQYRRRAETIVQSAFMLLAVLVSMTNLQSTNYLLFFFFLVWYYIRKKKKKLLNQIFSGCFRLNHRGVFSN